MEKFTFLADLIKIKQHLIDCKGETWVTIDGPGFILKARADLIDKSKGELRIINENDTVEFYVEVDGKIRYAGYLTIFK